MLTISGPCVPSLSVSRKTESGFAASFCCNWPCLFVASSSFFRGTLIIPVPKIKATVNATHNASHNNGRFLLAGCFEIVGVCGWEVASACGSDDILDEIPLTPLLQRGEQRITPLFQSGEQRVTPLFQSGKQRVTPLFQSGEQRVTPLFQSGEQMTEA